MGGIKQEVELDHLSRFKQERSIIEPLCSGFEISWARERKAYNTAVSVYILTPEKYIRETFGFNSQLALFIPHFKGFQPRVFQAINQMINEEPLIRAYLERDLGGEPGRPASSDFAALQQIILDELLLAIQEDLATISD